MHFMSSSEIFTKISYAHVVADLGSIPHSFTIDPLTAQFPVNSKHNYMYVLIV